jgi:DNA-binding response OmpR family regulator
MRILLIEDNEKLSQAIRVCLEQHGYCMDVAGGVAEGDEIAFTERHDAIILDVRLPDGDGVELCRRLRQQNVRAPILILSVLATTSEKVRGLDAGADDYLTKPFKTEELLARLRSLLRRSHAVEGGVLQAGDLKLSLVERMAYIGDEPVRMSNKEIALLEYLMRNPRKLLSRTMISESVWDMNYEPTSNVIDVYVSSLRRKIDRPGVRHIETVIGSGYRFIDDPETKGSAAPES